MLTILGAYCIILFTTCNRLVRQIQSVCFLDEKKITFPKLNIKTGGHQDHLSSNSNKMSLKNVKAFSHGEALCNVKLPQQKCTLAAQYLHLYSMTLQNVSSQSLNIWAAQKYQVETQQLNTVNYRNYRINTEKIFPLIIIIEPDTHCESN